jgi:hypothetical protein
MFRRVQKTLAAGLTGICCITIAAACFLGLSYAWLKGLDDLRPLVWLTFFVTQSALTLFVLGAVVTGPALELMLIAGAAGLVWLGWSMVDRTLSRPHFEGYAPLMGGIGMLQGALTFLFFAVEYRRNCPAVQTGR